MKIGNVFALRLYCGFKICAFINIYNTLDIENFLWNNKSNKLKKTKRNNKKKENKKKQKTPRRPTKDFYERSFDKKSR
jgi:hypothetical protein